MTSIQQLQQLLERGNIYLNRQLNSINLIWYLSFKKRIIQIFLSSSLGYRYLVCTGTSLLTEIELVSNLKNYDADPDSGLQIWIRLMPLMRIRLPK
jgi:hypothetical protein